MQLMDILGQVGGVGSIARELRVSESQAAAGALGGLLGGATPGAGVSAGTGAAPAGLGALASMLDLDGDGNPLDDFLGMAGQLTR